jgi:hypothetical protein
VLRCGVSLRATGDCVGGGFGCVWGAFKQAGSKESGGAKREVADK